MEKVIDDLSPALLATSVKANLYAMFQAIARSARAPMQSSYEGFSWHTGVAHPWFNGTLSALPPDSRAVTIIEDTVRDFQAHDVNSFTWWLAPHLDLMGWREHLLAYGFQYDDHTPGMAIELSTLPDTQTSTLTVKHVKDSRMLAEWTRTLIQGFGMPPAVAPPFLTMLERLGVDLPFRHYLGYLDGLPVATSTLFLGAGVAGIYNVATLPDVRGRGFGSHMTLAPLHEAHAMGHRVGVLQSSKMGYGVYERMGFQKVCQVDCFFWQTPSP